MIHGTKKTKQREVHKQIYHFADRKTETDREKDRDPPRGQASKHTKMPSHAPQSHQAHEEVRGGEVTREVMI